MCETKPRDSEARRAALHYLGLINNVFKLYHTGQLTLLEAVEDLNLGMEGLNRYAKVVKKEE